MQADSTPKHVYQQARGPAKNDLAGKRFGTLTATFMLGSYGGRCYWKCVCDCGNRTEVSRSNLTSGLVKSCGCGRGTHRASDTRLYRIWHLMKQRCTNPNAKSFRYYGGKGIHVCPEWLDFAPFQSWALANNYRSDLTIDRIDSDDGYNPKNCRWISQAENTRRRFRSPSYCGHKLDRIMAGVIRSFYGSGDFNYKSLSNVFSVSDTLIRLIVQEKCWKQSFDPEIVAARNNCQVDELEMGGSESK